MSDAPDLAHLDDPELDRALRARRIARWKRAILATFLIVFVPAYLVIKFGPFIGLMWSMRTLDRMPGPQMLHAPGNEQIISFGRHSQRLPRAATSPEEAGRALHGLLRWQWHGSGVLQPWNPDSADHSLIPAPDSNPTHLKRSRWPRELIPLAARGLTSAQREFLASVATGGDDTRFVVFARAARADIIGTRYTFEPAFAQPGGSMVLPIPHPSPLWRAADARIARAALAVAAGDSAAADSAIDEIAGAGLLLWDSDPEMSNAVAGVRLVAIAMRARAALDSVLGDTTGAREITDHLDSIERAAPLDPFFNTQPSVAQELAILPQLMARPDLPVSLKWSILRHVEVGRATRFCVGLSDSADWRAWADPARAALAHSRSDSLFFDWVAHPPSRAECRTALKKDPTA